MAGVVFTTLAISSCDEDTLTIGNSLTNESDELAMTTKSEWVYTNTLMADSVLSTASTCYLGTTEDPETHTEVKSEFSTQFNILQNLYISDAEYFVSKDDDGVTADSCDVVLFLNDPTSTLDALNAMTLRVRELGTMADPNVRYYSNFDITPQLRTENGAIDYSHPFSYVNMTDDEETRNASQYLYNIRIPLNQKYTDKDGQTYNNYGTYILRKLLAYKKQHNRFPNSYVFAHDICPGLLFQISSGIGFFTAIPHIGLRAYYRVNRDSIYNAVLTLAGTKEVMQTIKITNDKQTLDSLANLSTHTYLKTPAGLFTEALLPVESVWKGHENDSLLAAKISFQRINNSQADERMMTVPGNVLMVMKDSLHTFFEQNNLANSKTWFISTFNSSYNIYTFANISSLITQLWHMRSQYIAQDPTWGDPKSDHYKVVLVPVTYTSSSTTSTITSISHDLSLHSAKLVGGTNDPVELSLVFAKFKR